MPPLMRDAYVLRRFTIIADACLRRAALRQRYAACQPACHYAAALRYCAITIRRYDAR